MIHIFKKTNTYFFIVAFSMKIFKSSCRWIWTSQIEITIFWHIQRNFKRFQCYKNYFGAAKIRTMIRFAYWFPKPLWFVWMELGIVATEHCFVDMLGIFDSIIDVDPTFSSSVWSIWFWWDSNFCDVLHLHKLHLIGVWNWLLQSKSHSSIRFCSCLIIDLVQQLDQVWLIFDIDCGKWNCGGIHICVGIWNP